MNHITATANHEMLLSAAGASRLNAIRYGKPDKISIAKKLFLPCNDLKQKMLAEKLSPLHILQTRFGFSAFRLEQEAVINAVLEKKDTFVLMPTGGGKSLCYQIPALILNGLTIVISPLIALMKDQVDALRLNGIDAAFLNSTLSYADQDAILLQAISGKLKLLYLAPEKLLRAESNFFHTLTSCNIGLIAIDEAHCISHWGHDFRPEYLLLAQLKRVLPEVPTIALTATADRLTRKDILEKLELKDPATFVSSFNRVNIRYTVEEKRRGFDKLLSFLSKRKEDAGIIYCLMRSSTESLAQDLKENGYHALPYHAGMEKETRARHQELFLRDEVKIMVATTAFGMGIDKSNVRYVVHMDLPRSIENYYQETGRAGRDGVHSEALLLYSYGDVSKLKSFVKNDTNTAQKEVSLKKLDEMSRYGEMSGCRRKYLLNYFDEAAPDYCGNCDACLTTLEKVDATVMAQKALSAVSRLQERFGAGYIIDFLRGSDSAKISDYHKTMKTFGIGSDTSKDEWNHIVRELVARNYLTKSEGAYPVLKLTANSQGVLRGEVSVMINQVKERLAGADQMPDHERALFEQLKNIRRRIATEENVPAYVVLSDATLLEIATYLPQTIAELSQISGFGQVKLERYGQEFLIAIVGYANEHGLSSRINLRSPKKLRRDAEEKDSETKQITLDLFKQGNSMARIAELRKMTTSTIETHLSFYVQQGSLSVDRFMDVNKIPVIRAVVDKLGSDRLAMVKAALGDEYSYGEIRAAIAHDTFLKKDGGS